MKKIFSKIISLLFISGMASIGFTSCQKEENPQLRFSMNVEVSDITENSAKCLISVAPESGSVDIYHNNCSIGCIYDDKGYPSHNISTPGLAEPLSYPGQHTFYMLYLKSNTTYYVQGFVANPTSSGLEFIDGPVVTFTTLAGAPNLQIVSLKVNGDLYQNPTGSFTSTLKNNGCVP